MGTVSDYFGCLVFDDRVMKARLNADIYQSLRKTIDQGAKLDAGVANAVAAAMKDWAVEHGATHTTPTGSSRLPVLPLKSTTALFLPHRMAASSWIFPARS